MTWNANPIPLGSAATFKSSRGLWGSSRTGSTRWTRRCGCWSSSRRLRGRNIWSWSHGISTSWSITASTSYFSWSLLPTSFLKPADSFAVKQRTSKLKLTKLLLPQLWQPLLHSMKFILLCLPIKKQRAIKVCLLWRRIKIFFTFVAFRCVLFSRINVFVNSIPLINI